VTRSAGGTPFCSTLTRSQRTPLLALSSPEGTRHADMLIRPNRSIGSRPSVSMIFAVSYVLAAWRTCALRRSTDAVRAEIIAERKRAGAQWPSLPPNETVKRPVHAHRIDNVNRPQAAYRLESAPVRRHLESGHYRSESSEKSMPPNCGVTERQHVRANYKTYKERKQCDFSKCPDSPTHAYVPL
jgi:hypothetical protein